MGQNNIYEYMMDIELHYVSNRTLDEDVKTTIINPHILHDYEVIKKRKNYWGIFLRHKNEIIGSTLVAYEKEDNIDYLLLVAVYINDKSRGRNLGKALIEQTILKNEMQNKTNLVKVVIAGGMPMLKCLLSVFKELNYTIKKYKTTNENIQILQNILPETAIKIEQSNYESDIWQTLFFDKND
jgi:GNAT superfamily N-acetyltransferase